MQGSSRGNEGVFINDMCNSSDKVRGRVVARVEGRVGASYTGTGRGTGVGMGSTPKWP